mmetsp:Transcript_111100/g.220999  ORF Transcript_111100/g.220999 Transcript_111100/m.220999 type:complete len:300 (-) Transcript_111100:42-941(-)
MGSGTLSRPFCARIADHASHHPSRGQEYSSIHGSSSQMLSIQVRRVSGEHACLPLELPATTSVRELLEMVVDTEGSNDEVKFLLGNDLIDMTARSLTVAGIQDGCVLTLVVQKVRFWEAPVIGTNASITDEADGSMMVARVGRGFRDALVVGRQRVRFFHLKIAEIDRIWTGALEVGFTACEPQTLEMPLPEDALGLPSHWVMDSAGKFRTADTNVTEHADNISSDRNWSQQELLCGDLLRIAIDRNSSNGGATPSAWFVVKVNEVVKVKAAVQLERDQLLYPLVNIYGKTKKAELLSD